MVIIYNEISQAGRIFLSPTPLSRTGKARETDVSERVWRGEVYKVRWRENKARKMKVIIMMTHKIKDSLLTKTNKTSFPKLILSLFAFLGYHYLFTVFRIFL